MKYIVIETGKKPEVREIDENHFNETISELLGFTPELLYVDHTIDSDICYLGSTIKNHDQVNRLIHSWNNPNGIRGYIPNKVFVVYKRTINDLNKNEVDTICSTFGEKSIFCAKKLF